MQIGLDGFSQIELSQPKTIEFEYWNIICKEDQAWFKLNPDIVGLRRCNETPVITVEEINNAS